MNFLNLLGLLLVASPIIFLFIWMVRRDGWRTALTVFGLTCAIFVIVLSGAYLMTLQF